MKNRFPLVLSCFLFFSMLSDWKAQTSEGTNYKFPASSKTFSRVDELIKSVVDRQYEESDSGKYEDGLFDEESFYKDLVAEGKTPEEKVRTLYRYISETWGYDFGRVGIASPDKGKKRQPMNRGVCADIASQFVNAMGQAFPYNPVFQDERPISAGYVEGVARWERLFTGDYCGESPTPTQGHAWSIVEINGKQYIVDPTASATYKDQNGRPNERNINMHFLIPKEYADYIYLPFKGDKLLKKINWEENPYFDLNYFALGMNVVSHKQCIFETNKNISISIEAPTNVTVSAKVTPLQSENSAAELQAKRKGNLVILEGNVGSAGKYNLKIYANKPGYEYGGLAIVYRITVL